MPLFRGLLRRNRGVLAALAILLLACSWFGKPAPRASWTEPVPKSWGEGNGGHVEFAPDGLSVLTYDDESAWVRDLASGRVTTLELGGRKRLREARFMEGGRLLMAEVPGGDRLEDILPTIKVWEFPSGRQRASFSDIGDGSGWDYGISDDGSTLAYSMGPPGPPTLGIWRASKDWQSRYFPGHGPFSLSADGRFLALYETVDERDRVFIWDVLSSEIVASIAVAPSESGLIALSPDGRLLAVNAGDATFLWDVGTSSKRHLLATEDEGEPWISPDGSLLYPRGLFDHSQTADVWNMAARFPRRQGEGGRASEVWDIAVDPPRRVFRGKIADRSRDGRRIIQEGPNDRDTLDTEAPEGPVARPKVVRLPSLKPLGRDLDEDYALSAFAPDGRTLALTIYRDEPTWLGNLAGWLPRGLIPSRWCSRHERGHRVLDVESGRVLASIEHPARFTLDRFALVGNGKTLALHYLIPADGQDTPWKDAGIELWDVPGPSSKWPILCGLAVVTIVSGRWYDVRARRRANAASVPD